MEGGARVFKDGRFSAEADPERETAGWLEADRGISEQGCSDRNPMGKRPQLAGASDTRREAGERVRAAVGDRLVAARRDRRPSDSKRVHGGGAGQWGPNSRGTPARPVASLDAAAGRSGCA